MYLSSFYCSMWADRALSPALSWSVWNNNKKKRSVNALAREMLPTCRVNVQITLKFSNLWFFSSKILEIFENSFWCLKFSPKFRNYVASNFFIGLATPRTKKFEAYILSSLIFFFVERPARVLLGVLIYLFTCWSIFLTQTPYLH